MLAGVWCLLTAWIIKIIPHISNGGWFWISSVGIQTGRAYKKTMYNCIHQLGVFIDEDAVDSVDIPHVSIYLTLKLMNVTVHPLALVSTYTW